MNGGHSCPIVGDPFKSSTAGSPKINGTLSSYVNLRMDSRPRPAPTISALTPGFSFDPMPHLQPPSWLHPRPPCHAIDPLAVPFTP